MPCAAFWRPGGGHAAAAAAAASSRASRAPQAPGAVPSGSMWPVLGGKWAVIGRERAQGPPIGAANLPTWRPSAYCGGAPQAVPTLLLAP